MNMLMIQARQEALKLKANGEHQRAEKLLNGAFFMHLTQRSGCEEEKVISEIYKSLYGKSFGLTGVEPAYHYDKVRYTPNEKTKEMGFIFNGGVSESERYAFADECFPFKIFTGQGNLDEQVIVWLGGYSVYLDGIETYVYLADGYHDKDIVDGYTGDLDLCYGKIDQQTGKLIPMTNEAYYFERGFGESLASGREIKAKNNL